jgi:hypothetical protein
LFERVTEKAAFVKGGIEVGGGSKDVATGRSIAAPVQHRGNTRRKNADRDAGATGGEYSTLRTLGAA